MVLLTFKGSVAENQNKNRKENKSLKLAYRSPILHSYPKSYISSLVLSRLISLTFLAILESSLFSFKETREGDPLIMPS